LTSSRKHILKIGVTGGIGSGKSSVCAIFAHFGVPILFADDIAKDISTADPSVRKKIIAVLGKAAYHADGSLNRPFLTSKIFADTSMRRTVEEIIHPRVEKEIAHQTRALALRGESIVIVEAALIYEAGLHKTLDAVIVVHADEAERIRRVRTRDKVSEQDVRSRIAAQLDAVKKLEQADYIIYNNGTREELESKVHFLYSVFTQLADGGTGV
jgi:dephospho-CoA kinase